jgi:hypothetical protein
MYFPTESVHLQDYTVSKNPQESVQSTKIKASKLVLFYAIFQYFCTLRSFNCKKKHLNYITAPVYVCVCMRACVLEVKLLSSDHGSLQNLRNLRNEFF